MAAKKSRSSSDKQLKDTIRTLEAKLQRAEAKAARWKARSKRSQAEVGTLKARNAKLDKKLTKAADAARLPRPRPRSSRSLPWSWTHPNPLLQPTGVAPPPRPTGPSHSCATKYARGDSRVSPTSPSPS